VVTHAREHRHHEPCPHFRKPGIPAVRVRYQDGCQTENCEACSLYPLAPDALSMAMLDPDGIPWDKGAWTAGDAMGNVLRAVERSAQVPQAGVVDGLPPRPGPEREPGEPLEEQPRPRRRRRPG
jgi:hypothetical protein